MKWILPFAALYVVAASGGCTPGCDDDDTTPTPGTSPTPYPGTPTPPGSPTPTGTPPEGTPGDTPPVTGTPGDTAPPDSPTPGGTTPPGALIPVAPCDPGRVVVHYYKSIEQCSATGEYPPTYTGLRMERLYDCEWIQLAARALSDTKEQEVVVDLQQTFVAVATDEVIDEEDIRFLQEAGYEDVEFNCPIAGMESGARRVDPTLPERELRGSDGASSVPGVSVVLPTGWHAVQTGAASAVPSASVVLPTGWHAVQTGAASVVPDVLSRYESTGYHPRVAVIDSGIAAEFAKQFGAVVSSSGWSYDGSDWLSDGLGHGTSVTAVVLETSAYQSEITSIKVLNDQGRGDQISLARGLMAAGFVFDVDLVNLSLGYPERSVPEGSFWKYLEDPLVALTAKGTRVYAAAGNACGDDNCDEFLPASAPTVSRKGFSIDMNPVSGLNPAGEGSSQAAGCESPIWAPSEFVCMITSASASSSGYWQLSGTSFAAPQVTGAVALFMLWPGGPNDADAAHDVVYKGRDKELRMNLCQVMDILGYPVQGCTSWQTGLVDPADFRCALPYDPASAAMGGYDYSGATVESGIEETGYDPSYGYGTTDTADQGVDAVWCSGLYSAPSIPICTSCQYCFTAGTASRTAPSAGPGFQLMLNLGNLAGYSSIQLKVKALDSVGATAYYYFPLSITQADSYKTINYVGTYSPELKSPSEAWLVARQNTYSEWSGVPLMRTSCN